MDWYKAKKYIIIMLAAMNIILLISIFAHNNNVSIDNPYFSRDSLRDFDNILQKEGIELATELPRNIYNVGVINVEYEDINQESHPKLFEDFPETKILENNKKIELQIKQQKIPMLNGKKFNISDADNRKKFAEEFLAIYFAGHGYNLKFKNQDSLLIYNPVIDNRIFEDSYVEFVFDEGSVTISAIAIHPRQNVENGKRSTTSVEGVLNALPSLSEGDKIIAIDFIYYFDLSDEELYKVKNARAFPHWRIITDTSKVVYVSAFKY